MSDDRDEREEDDKELTDVFKIISMSEVAMTPKVKKHMFLASFLPSPRSQPSFPAAPILSELPEMPFEVASKKDWV